MIPDLLNRVTRFDGDEQHRRTVLDHDDDFRVGIDWHVLRKVFGQFDATSHVHLSLGTLGILACRITGRNGVRSVAPQHSQGNHRDEQSLRKRVNSHDRPFRVRNSESTA